MDKRKALHDASMLLIFFAALDVFTSIRTLVFSFIDGSFENAMASVEPDLYTAVAVCVFVVFALALLLVAGGVFIGCKGLKVSREPVADKGYITAAKAFLVLSVLSVVTCIVTLFDNNADMVDMLFSLVNAVLDVIAYFLFVKAANAVRTEFLERA